MKVKARLVIELEYEGEDALPKNIQNLLQAVGDEAYAEGMFSGDFLMDVNSWDSKITTKVIEDD